MATVQELLPGEQTVLPGPFGTVTGTFVARTQHPIWPNLQLVIWRLDDGTWSHDALDARQDVGEVQRSSHQRRMDNLRAAVLGEGRG